MTHFYQDISTLKKQFLCFFLLFAVPIFSQNSVTGSVLDRSNTPISQVNVQIKDSKNDKIIAFSFSDTSGNFRLELDKKGLYILKISYLGLKSFTKEIEITNNLLDVGKIILEENKIDLENVIIKNEAAGMTEIGDTLRYRIEKFLNGTEETLKDVIKKLPGLDIDAQGKIKANGKEVDKLLINGEEFFINQQKIATENITAEMIKNIELIKNYTEFKNIKKNDKSGITALNVNIKEQFKNKLTGNVSAAAGDNRYKLHATLFNFSKKTLFSLISDSNNTGELSMNIEEYTKFTNQNEARTIGETTFSKNDDLPRFLTIGNNVKERSSYFTGLNLKYSPTKKTQVNFYSIFNSVDQVEQQSNTQFYASNSGVFSNKDSRFINEETVFTNSALDVAYKPNEKSLISYKGYFSGVNKINTVEIANNTNQLNNANKLTDYTINHQLNYTTLYKNNTGLNISVKQQIIKKSNRLNIESDAPFLNLNFNNSTYKILQNSQLNKNNIDLNTNYTFSIKKTTNAIFMESSIRQDDYKTTEEQFTQFENNVNIENKVQTIGLQTKFKLFEKTTFSSAFSYSRLQFKMDNLNKAEWLFMPTLSLKTDFNSNHYIKLSFSQNNNLTQAENLVPNNVISDYRTIFSNENLRLNTITPNNQLAADYFYFNNKRKLSIISNLSYYKATNIISNNSSADATVNLIQYAVAPFENRFQSMLYSEKTFSFLPFSLRASVSYSSSSKILFYDSLSQTFKTESTSAYLSFVSRLKKTSLQFETGVAVSRDNYQDNFFSNSILIVNPFIETSYKIATNLSFINKFSYKNITASTSYNEIYMLSPRLRLNFPKSKFEISLIAHDILNINNYEQITLTRFDNFTEERISQSLTGYYLLNIKFKL
ncbi:carboxypeptidase-like regulatory domain-containing protein [Flavobacterium xanthum]|uniref:CarboxypepD_reg-like domain-containing protein n=1 Tax=Flavobacterium xanthum TaxID=69322 RepID=A0A1M7BVQ5_9FLAO|nr:carboxypeptidase-like regulatory domain-containing protein [Flavobacterium xanthum]SHL59092.1 CarboxypepD_reg-like domain-containing protein [Flavobacterium xanthum]